MKRLTLIALIVFTIFGGAYGMTPAPDLIYECPKCGAEKHLQAFKSSNTFGGTQWSDSYQWYPMQPRLSYIQKCPACGSFFLLSDADRHQSDDTSAYTADIGRLKYKEMKEALSLLNDTTLTPNQIRMIRFEFLYRYNDAFRKNDYYANRDDPTRSEDDLNLYKENIKELIAMADKTNQNDILIIAELYREAGDFEHCISLLKDYKTDSDFMNRIAAQILEKAINNDDKVFMLVE